MFVSEYCQQTKQMVNNLHSCQCHSKSTEMNYSHAQWRIIHKQDIYLRNSDADELPLYKQLLCRSSIIPTAPVTHHNWHFPTYDQAGSVWLVIKFSEAVFDHNTRTAKIRKPKGEKNFNTSRRNSTATSQCSTNYATRDACDASPDSSIMSQHLSSKKEMSTLHTKANKKHTWLTRLSAWADINQHNSTLKFSSEWQHVNPRTYYRFLPRVTTQNLNFLFTSMSARVLLGGNSCTTCTRI